jgi:hypothetical protein
MAEEANVVWSNRNVKLCNKGSNKGDPKCLEKVRANVGDILGERGTVVVVPPPPPEAAIAAAFF